MQINQDELFKRYTKPTSKHKHEYQAICSDLEKDFGKRVWTLPHMLGVTDAKLKRAAVIARDKGILKFAYLLAIIHNL